MERENKKEEKKWKKFKNKLKDEYQKTKTNVKETYNGIKSQFDEKNVANRPSKNYYKKKKSELNLKKKKVDLKNLDLFCPYCETPLPEESKSIINGSGTIICERCGTEIQKNSFFKKYSD